DVFSFHFYVPQTNVLKYTAPKLLNSVVYASPKLTMSIILPTNRIPNTIAVATTPVIINCNIVEVSKDICIIYLYYN
ncbi:MAG: hypothetical protein ACTSO2_17510, partial [Promethearchaeota archaeon]